MPRRLTSTRGFPRVWHRVTHLIAVFLGIPVNHWARVGALPAGESARSARRRYRTIRDPSPTQPSYPLTREVRELHSDQARHGLLFEMPIRYALVHQLSVGIAIPRPEDFDSQTPACPAGPSSRTPSR
jgi:hypothetical protein